MGVEQHSPAADREATARPIFAVTATDDHQPYGSVGLAKEPHRTSADRDGIDSHPRVAMPPVAKALLEWVAAGAIRIERPHA